MDLRRAGHQRSSGTIVDDNNNRTDIGLYDDTKDSDPKAQKTCVNDASI